MEKTFQTAHSVDKACEAFQCAKAMAVLIGWKHIGDQALSIETLVEGMQAGKTSPDAKIIDSLLRRMGELKAMFDNVLKGENVKSGKLSPVG